MSLPRTFCLVDDRVDVALIADLVDAGVTGIQVRAKELPGRDLLALTEAIIAVVRPRQGLVVVNDRLDVALAADADGVHLGGCDLAVRDARRVAPELVIGATCRSAADVARAAADGADYAGFGPIFTTTSKPGLPPPLGVAAITTAAGTLPLLAIGGITVQTAGDVRNSGAYGVAVIGGLLGTPDPVATAHALAAVVAEGVSANPMACCATPGGRLDCVLVSRRCSASAPSSALPGTPPSVARDGRGLADTP